VAVPVLYTAAPQKAFQSHLPRSSSYPRAALRDQKFMINPAKLGFLPRDFWNDADVQFDVVVKSFFRRRNMRQFRFPYKLFNALLISETFPNAYDYVGVKWLTDDVFLVRPKIFGELLNLKSVEGALFHQQGNFPSHGFVMIPPAPAPAIGEQLIEELDFDLVKLTSHPDGAFRRDRQDIDVDKLSWARTVGRQVRV
jgi:hypothetical protein